MKIDRAMQRRILEQAVNAYPGDFDPAEDLPDDYGNPEFAGNAMYLRDHGMIAGPLSMHGTELYYSSFKATVSGIDFMQHDGGLSAIQSIVTVRFEADTLRALLLNKIDASAQPDHEKSVLRKGVETASEEALRTTTQKLVEQALATIPDALQLIRTLLPAMT